MDRSEQDTQAATFREHVRTMNAARQDAEYRLRTESRKGDDRPQALAAYRIELAGISAEHDVWAATHPQIEAPVPQSRKASSRQSS